MNYNDALNYLDTLVHCKGMTLGDAEFTKHVKQALQYLDEHRPITQDWVARLGLRYQGVLMAAVRGCDTAGKHDGTKTLTRYYRSAVLNAHCGDPAKARSFISLPTDAEAFEAAVKCFFDEMDALPNHFVLHFVHAAEIVGYYHPPVPSVPFTRYIPQPAWFNFYLRACRKLHMNPETKEQLAARLDVDEASFAKAQRD